MSAPAETTREMQRLSEARQRHHTRLPLHEETDEAGAVTHQGVALFDTAQQRQLNDHLWRGIERILLSIELQPNDQERRRWMEEHHVRLFLEACPFGSGTFQHFSRAYPILHEVTGIRINEDEERWRVFIAGGKDSTTLRLSLPKERELIYGTDKKEEDDQQRLRIEHYAGKPFAPHPLPDTTALYATPMDDIWHTAGEALYIDSLRNEGYYKVDHAGHVSPVWSERHRRESVVNLLLGNYLPQTSFSVEISHRLYGGRTAERQTQWQQLLAALMDEEGIRPYAAASSSSRRGTTTGILLLRNSQFGYAHLLLLSLPTAQVGTTAPIEAQAMLYTNIPQHNLLTLFEEFQLSR